MKKGLLIIGALYALSMGACSGGDEPTPDSTGGAASLLSANNWQIQSSTSVTYVPGADSISYDLYAMMAACTKDNFSKYNSSGTITVDEGPTKCNASDPQTKTDGNWELLESGTILKIVHPSRTLNCTVHTLNSTTLDISYTTTDNGFTSKTRTVYKKI